MHNKVLSARQQILVRADAAHSTGIVDLVLISVVVRLHSLSCLLVPRPASRTGASPARLRLDVQD